MRQFAIVGLFAVALAGSPAPARTACNNNACGALREVIANRNDGFAKLRGAVSFRRSNGQAGEYDAKAKLPGARTCNVEIVNAALPQGVLYLCLFPNASYAQVKSQYDRYSDLLKQAVPAKWVTWQVSGKRLPGRPGPSLSFRAGPNRSDVALEVVILLPRKGSPHLAVLGFPSPSSRTAHR